MAVTQTFRDLDVYNKAYDAAIEIHKASLEFPKIEQYAIADQMRRASKGICANIAEGFGKQFSSRQEFKRFLFMAMGSANEMIVWSQFCETLGYADLITSQRWQKEYDSIARMLNMLIQAVHSAADRQSA